MADLHGNNPTPAAVLPHEEQQKPVVHPTADVPTTQTAQEQVRRSGGSDSDSSLEADGEGGRRKKTGSLKEELKGAFDGARKDKDKAAGDEAALAHPTTTTAAAAAGDVDDEGVPITPLVPKKRVSVLL